MYHIDMIDRSVSQDMIGTMRDSLTAMPEARSLAIVTDSSLARMQVRRLFQQC